MLFLKPYVDIFILKKVLLINDIPRGLETQFKAYLLIANISECMALC